MSPFRRVGKCVKNTETGKSKGCSETVAMAKKHVKALYANMPKSEKNKKKP